MYIPTKTISSMVTSFNDKNELDLEGLVENIEFQKKAGIESICVLGGTGEAASLSKVERHQIMETTMKNSGNLKVVIGALAGTPKDIEEDIIKAKELKADAVMVMATPFIKPSERDIEKFITDLSNLGIPLIIFNTPSRSSVNMSKELILKLSELDAVVGIKESSGELNLVEEIIQNVKEDFGVLVGGDTLYLPSLVLGAHGGIVAVATVIPEVFVALDNAIVENDINKARKLHYIIKLLDDVMYKASHPVPLKKALEIRGLPVGKARPPFSDLDEGHEKELYKVMQEVKNRGQGLVQFVSEYS